MKGKNERRTTPSDWDRRVAGIAPTQFSNRVTQIRQDFKRFFSEILGELNNCRICLDNHKRSFTATVDIPDYQLLISWRYRLIEIRDEICWEQENREAIEEDREANLAALGECPTDETGAREWYKHLFRLKGMDERDIADRYLNVDEDLRDPTEFLYRTPRKRDDDAIQTLLDDVVGQIRLS